MGQPRWVHSYTVWVVPGCVWLQPVAPDANGRPIKTMRRMRGLLLSMTSCSYPHVQFKQSVDGVIVISVYASIISTISNHCNSSMSTCRQECLLVIQTVNRKQGCPYVHNAREVIRLQSRSKPYKGFALFGSTFGWHTHRVLSCWLFPVIFLGLGLGRPLQGVRPPHFMRCLRYMQDTREGGRWNINALVRVLISDQFCLLYTILDATEQSPRSRLRTVKRE